MLRPTVLLKRSLIFLHRWLGVALAVLFMLWFCSGIVMMYWSFPEVSARDRLERAPELVPARIMLSPEQAYAALHRDQPPGKVRLTTLDGRPVYRFSAAAGGGGGQSIVFADDGTEQKQVDAVMLDRVAAAWARQSITAAKKESVEEVDQWTVGGQLRTLRPLFKYTFADGQQVYVSGRDAEVVQYTTSESRFWAYLGAVPHWLYFTPLRKNQPFWFQLVVWASGIGAVSAILGIIVALWMLSPSKRYRHTGAPTSIPYRGWKRWHTIAGLAFGVFATTWAFSGMLSMGPFDWLERLAGTQRARPDNTKKGEGRRGADPGRLNIANALRGSERFTFAAFAVKDPRDAIQSVNGRFHPRELEFTMFAGESVYLATDDTGATRIIPTAGEPRTEFDSAKIMDLVRETAGANLAELRLMEEYDSYYLDRNGRRPLPVIYALTNDENKTRYYIDPKTGTVAGNYSTRNWINRWLYHGLHSLDFPWLYKHRPLWDIVVITLMLGGTALCVTSLLLAWRVLQRKIVRLIRRGIVPESTNSEDLAPAGLGRG